MNLEERPSEILDVYEEFFDDPSDSKPESESQKQEIVGEVESLSSDAAERLQELFEADPIFKDDLYTPAPIGKRSDAEFHLCARLWEAGFNEAEIYVIMSSSPQTKWLDRDDNYRQETIRKAIVSAEANHKKKVDEEAEKEAAKKAAPIELKDIADIEYDDEGELKEVRFSPTFAAKVVLERLNLAMSEDSEDVYRFTGQIYKPDGARKIDRALSKAAADLFTAYQLRETLRRIRNELLENPVIFDPDPYMLGVKNGVVNLLTGEVREYQAEDLILDQIPVTYDPSAKCPAFLAFLISITPNISDRITLIDWFVANGIKEPFAYVLFLLGLGRNGKGVYEKLLKKFFGPTAFRDMDLAQVTKNNFAAGQFYRKRGWIASETETQKGKTVIGTDFIKMVSGSGTIDSDRKNQSRIQFDPYFKTIVDTNNMPRIEDQSRGWKERFIKTDLPYAFLVDPDPNNPLEKQRDPDILKKMSTPSELSGILNLLLFRSQTIGKSCTIHKRPPEEMFAEYNEQSSSVGTFLERFCEHDSALSGLMTPIGPIYEAYKVWCEYKVGEVVDTRYFGRQLKKFCGGNGPIITKTKERESIRGYRGLVFDDKKHRAAIDALKDSMSTVCLQESTSLSTLERSQCITMSTLSTSNIWIDIIEKFGNPSNVQKCTMDEKSLYREEICENNVDNVDNVDINKQRACGQDGERRHVVDTNVDTSIKADLQHAHEKAKAKDEHFRTPEGLEAKLRSLNLKSIYVPKGRAYEYSHLALNPWRGCSHGCTYCYGPNATQQTQEDFHSRYNVRTKSVTLERIEQDIGVLKSNGIREPVHLCFTNDPYDRNREDGPYIRSILEIFNKLDYPAVVLTKSDLAIRDFDLYLPDWEFWTTLTTMDTAKAAIEEPQASPPNARLKALVEAHKLGIKTAVSNEPIWSLEDSLGVIEAVKGITDEIKVGPLNHDPRAASIDYWSICPKIKDALVKSGTKHLLKRDFKKFLAAPSSLKVRFNLDYPSDWHGAMRLFKEGEIVEISAERAEIWIKRGVVELVVES